MKRNSKLYESIISIENLHLADRNARRGKLRSYGVQLHDRHREENIEKLHQSLADQTYRTSEYHIFTIHEPKEREIYQLPYYPDRIVHHAVMNILEPIWTSIFTADTYACIKGKGIHGVVKKMKHVLRTDPQDTRYCLKLDIKKFYPSIDHEILKKIVRRRIKDPRLLMLLDEIIDSVPDEKGVPIGNYLSQYFANIYLAYFDHWVKESKRVKYYWRYADDIVILSPDKATLHWLMHDIRRYLKDNLRLTVKRNYQVFPVAARGIDFAGYVFRHTHTALRKRIKQRLCRRVASMKKRKKAPTIKEYQQQLASWWGWCKYCDSINLINKIKKEIPYEIKFISAQRAV